MVERWQTITNEILFLFNHVRSKLNLIEIMKEEVICNIPTTTTTRKKEQGKKEKGTEKKEKELEI